MPLIQQQAKLLPQYSRMVSQTMYVGIGKSLQIDTPCFEERLVHGHQSLPIFECGPLTEGVRPKDVRRYPHRPYKSPAPIFAFYIASIIDLFHCIAEKGIKIALRVLLHGVQQEG